MKIKSEFRFTLPSSTIDDDKKVKGTMRLIKVKDLIEISQDSKVQESSSYFYVVLLSRVITSLGASKMVNRRTIENLSTMNFSFLVDFLNEINHSILQSFPVKCSGCDKIYTSEITLVGEL